MATPFNEPVYRVVLKDAFVFTWREKKLWIFATIAGFLLTGSLYDVVWSKLNALGAQGSIVTTFAPFLAQAQNTWSHLSVTQLIFGSLNVFLLTAFLLILIFAVYSASVIAQSALVYSVGSKKNEAPPIREALMVGARAMWPVFALNIIASAVLMALRSLVAIILAFVSTNPGSGSFYAYIFAFVFFTAVAIAVVIVHIFALNAMILQGATLAQSIERGITLLSRHWLVATETGAILFLISVAGYIAIIIGGLLLAIPYGILLFTAALIKSGFIFAAVTVVFLALFLVLTIAIFGFIVLLNYASWTYLFRRFGEGGVVPKLHRLVRSFTHQTKVPGA
ncbi:MAG: hypothetical protein WC477_02935 [Patescibacteria group bacterium]